MTFRYLHIQPATHAFSIEKLVKNRVRGDSDTHNEYYA